MHDGEEDDWGGGARPAAPHVSRAPDEQRAVGGQFRTAGPAVAKVVAGAEKRFAEETPRAGKAGEDALPAGKGGAGRVGPRATAPPAEHLLGGKRGHLPPAAGGVSGKKKAPRIAEKAKQQKGGGQERGRKHGPVPRKVPH
ncbi:unnamed protein product [Pedinophyceae sp. YPF-701]|nr:unnamed protein product [Pedinophyceae sp. YPF-701]